MRYYGVVLDVTPHGMRVRMMEPLQPGTRIGIQMMRDEDYSQPLAQALDANVVRSREGADGFVDLGVRIVPKEVRRVETRPVHTEKAPALRSHRERMYSLDVTVGGRRRGHTGR